MSLDPKLLDLLCCPISHKPLKPAPETLIESFCKLKQLDRSEWPQALVTLDEKRAYPVREGIPVLLPEAAVDLDN